MLYIRLNEETPDRYYGISLTALTGSSNVIAFYLDGDDDSKKLFNNYLINEVVVSSISHGTLIVSGIYHPTSFDNLNASLEYHEHISMEFDEFVTIMTQLFLNIRLESISYNEHHPWVVRAKTLGKYLKSIGGIQQYSSYNTNDYITLSHFRNIEV